jgi:SPP1 family predicted phage head-tail adaptor
MEPAAGELRERVTIQRVTSTRDAIGGVIETWSTLMTVYAKVAPMSAGEQYRRQQIQAKADWKVTVRYANTIAPADRIVWRERTFQIKGITNPDMRRRFLDLACEELQVSQTAVGYTPSLDFSDYRNSQYLGQVA